QTPAPALPAQGHVPDALLRPHVPAHPRGGPGPAQADLPQERQLAHPHAGPADDVEHGDGTGRAVVRDRRGRDVRGIPPPYVTPVRLVPSSATVPGLRRYSSRIPRLARVPRGSGRNPQSIDGPVRPEEHTMTQAYFEPLGHGDGWENFRATEHTV